ncbi:hypothetical protein EST38_g1687 [Candolleomyces aberdarensis]|uniref:NYN domain-containing protein n=1 Tax=Candolleomyces aberdarensis TaxID=2316362 RepID=A0A4V1Q534_9AGAR|nr:hypothetical protein EST38_g1687 [Candolleomyces aberdarensis]
MAHKPRRDVYIFWDFDSCPAPTEASGYTIANHIRTLSLRLGIVKSFKAYLSISDHHTSGRALTLRSELQSSGVSLTDAPGAKEIADKMLIVDMLAHAFDSNPESDSNIIMLITGDPSFSYLLSILRMRNYRVVVLGPGGGPEDYSNNSASLASQANLWLDWNTEVMDGIIPRSTSTGVSSASRTIENLNSTSDSTKSESPSDSREKPVSTIAETTSVRAQTNKENEAKMDSTTDQEPIPQSTLQEPVESKSFTRLSWHDIASKSSTTLSSSTVTEGEDQPIPQSALQEPVKSESFARLSWDDIASKPSTALSATVTEGEDQPIPQPPLQEPVKSKSFTRLSWHDIASKSSTALSSTVAEGEDRPIPQSTLQEPVKLKSFTRLSWSDIASRASTALSATVTKGEDLPQDSTVNSKPTTTSDKEKTQNLPKPQPQPAATVLNTSSDSGTQSSQLRDRNNPLDLAPESTPLSTWGDWPSSQAAPAPSPWNNKPHGNPPEYSLNASGWTSNKAASSTPTEAIVPPEFDNLVKVLRLSTVNGVRKPLWGVIAFELIKQDPRVYEKAGVARFSAYVALAIEKGIVTTGGPQGVEWVTLHRNFC